MSTFPLSTIPYGNLTAILGKLSFEESARMRQTCRQMKETIAKADIAFPLIKAGPISYKLIIYLSEYSIENSYIDPCLYCYNHYPERQGRIIRFDHGHEDELFAPPRCIERARVDKLMGARHAISRTQEYLKEAKIRCSVLRIANSDIDIDGMLYLAKTLHPRKIIFFHQYGNSPPFSFDILKEISAICQDVRIVFCDGVDPGYTSILNQFKSIHIVDVESKSMPSLVPLIQLWLSGSSSLLKHFELPYYNRETLLTPEEVEELDLEKWRVRRDTKEDAFVIDTGKEYITLTGHPNYIRLGYPNYHETRRCIGRRTLKTEVDPAVLHWIEVFLPWKTVPFDASGLYESTVKNLNDFQMVKTSLERMSSFAYSTYEMDL